MKALQVAVSLLLLISLPQCTSLGIVNEESSITWSVDSWRKASLAHRFSQNGFFPATRSLSPRVEENWWIPLSYRWMKEKTHNEDKKILEEFYYSLGSEDLLRKTLAAHPYWMERLMVMAQELRP